MALSSKPVAVTSGNKIYALELNNLVDYFNDIWTGGSYSFDSNHTSITDNRRYGWGQSPATINPAILTGSLITRLSFNQAIAQVNAGQYHTEDNPTLLHPKIADTHTNPISPPRERDA